MSGLSKWKREVAFVPQDDVMHRDLTVRDNIMFNARLRLPSAWNEDEIKEHVDWILDTLEIDHVQVSVSLVFALLLSPLDVTLIVL